MGSYTEQKLNMTSVGDTGAADASLVPKALGVPTPFFALTLLAFVTRIVIRIRRKRIGFDDASLAAGMVRDVKDQKSNKI